MAHIKFPRVFYGGDYNPDQWPREIWQEDMRLFKLAHINIATLPVFSWAKLQPSEDNYDFTWLDEILGMMDANGVKACLATSTAAHPAWMSKKYPEVLPVTSDGRKRTHGARVNFCPNSTVYRRFSTKLASEMANRYKDHPALALWHIGNEYGNYCYCDKCTEAFRNWVKARYKTIEEVNRVWNMSFWGHTIYDWDEIVLPSSTNNDDRCFQGISLDYNRFMSDSSLQCYLGEYKALKEITPDVPVTTNLMGTYKPLDYFEWAKHMDIVSWDNYPSAQDCPADAALRHDLMRGLKDGQPFMLMEQTPSQQNWQAYCSLKRPGVMRLQSYQAMAHGADSIMFFQLRRSFGACEKYHGAVIAHVGNENTRVFKECTQLGQELENLGDVIIGSRVDSKVAIVFDWDNWWALELSSGPSVDLKYIPQISRFYKAFHDKNIPLDMVRPDADLSQYDIVVTPVLYMVKPGVADNLKTFVANGGTLLTTFFSGIVDQNDLVRLGGYPGELRDLLGIWVEEIDSLYPHMKNSLVMKEKIGLLEGSYECGFLCDLLHTEGAVTLATYGDDFYAGMPALTVNKYGKGRAYYLATHAEERFLADLTSHLCQTSNVNPVVCAPSGVEAVERVNSLGERVLFLLNHNPWQTQVNLAPGRHQDLLTGALYNCDDGTIRVELPSFGVCILKTY